MRCEGRGVSRRLEEGEHRRAGAGTRAKRRNREGPRGLGQGRSALGAEGWGSDTRAISKDEPQKKRRWNLHLSRPLLDKREASAREVPSWRRLDASRKVTRLGERATAEVGTGQALHRGRARGGGVCVVGDGRNPRRPAARRPSRRRTSACPPLAPWQRPSRLADQELAKLSPLSSPFSTSCFAWPQPTQLSNRDSVRTSVPKMMSFDSLPRGFAPQPFAPSFPLGASASQAQGSPGGAQSPSCGSPQLPTSPQDPLSLRCRQLASSIGRDAFEHVADPAQAQPSPLGSPKRLSPERDGRGSPPGRSPGPPPAHAGLWASPHLSGTDYPLSPVGSSLFLGEISEEGEDGSAGPLGGGTVGAGGPVVGGGRPSLAHGFEYAQGESAVASSSETSTSSSAWAGNGGSFRDYVGGSFYSVSSASLGLADDEASASGGEGVTPTKSAPGRSNLTIQAASLGLSEFAQGAGPSFGVVPKADWW